jgi:hypothetical protein
MATLPNSSEICLEILESQPPGTFRACPEQYRDCLMNMLANRKKRTNSKFKV